MQPVKLIVIEASALPPGAIGPRGSGNAAGLVTNGVQAGPEVCVKVKPVMETLFAIPGPSLFRLTIHSLPLAGPDFPLIEPTSDAALVAFTISINGGETLALKLASPEYSAVME